MKKTIMALKEVQGMKVLGKDAQRNVTGGMCAASDGHGGVSYFRYENGNKERAIAYAAEHGGRWCCDGCAHATWMNPEKANSIPK